MYQVFDSIRSDAPAVFFVTYIEFYMKVIIISFLLTVTTFLLAIFMASIFNMFASVINITKVSEKCSSAKKKRVTPFFEVRTALCNGKWVYGYSVWLVNGGTSDPCMRADYKESFKTEKEAFDKACCEVREYLSAHKRVSSPYESGVEIDSHSQELIVLLANITKPKYVQLSLF